MAFTFISSFLYFQDMDTLDDMQKDLYRQGIAAFDGIAPTYHIELLEKPTIVWDFHSLLLAIQMMFSFMLTEEKEYFRTIIHRMKSHKLLSVKHFLPCGIQFVPRFKSFQLSADKNG